MERPERGEIHPPNPSGHIRKNSSLSPEELKAGRGKRPLSQAVFALYRHTDLTTCQNWEQGRAKPNPQAVPLIRMVEQRPGTLSTRAAL